MSKLFALEIGENFVIHDCKIKRHSKENTIMLFKGSELITILDFEKVRFALTWKSKNGSCLYRLIDKK